MALPRALARLLTVLIVVFAALAGGARAQEPSDAELGEIAPVVRDLHGQSPKFLALVFDVSGSMKQTGYMKRARKAAIGLLKNAAQPGDRVALFAFGSRDEKLFDTTLKSKADISTLIEKVPYTTGVGAGTNIRRPHHEALKIADSLAPEPAAIVLMTDSFNDQPRPDDPAFTEYKKYYIPGARLDRYPDTPENRDYERLLARFKESGGKAYGIGIELDPTTGRPIERNPQDAPPTPEATPEPQQTSSAPPPPKPASPLPWILGALAAVVLGALYFILGGNRPYPVRVRVGVTGAPRDFSLKTGQTLRLGGGTAASLDAVPLAGAKEAVAVVRAERRGLILTPQPNAAARVFHNGLALESPSPLRYGDEVRVTLPDPSGSGLSKDIRIAFSDPSKEI